MFRYIVKLIDEGNTYGAMLIIIVVEILFIIGFVILLTSDIVSRVMNSLVNRGLR